MTARQKVFRLTLSSNPRSIGKVEAFLAKIKRVRHLDEIQFHKLMVSLTEAVNNAIIHGNKSNEAKKVTIRAELLPGWLVIRVHDQGRGFDPDAVRSPLRKRNLLKESGRGIFLMRTLMDRVAFEVTRAGVQVQLWMNLNKSDPGHL